ncbi:MAG: cyclin-like protein [Benniella sp.]|nr:MAG: cyclin-like protein [Benniella sp.]
MSQNKLSLQNALLTLEQLQRTPSREDGITEEQEDNMRQLGCHLIQTTGILLKLPQVAMATAQILFQRFFYLASLRKFAVRDISMGSIFLAAKVEECPCRLSDLVNVIDHLTKKFRRRPVDPLILFSQEFYNLKDAVVIAEMQILKKLGFNVHVQLPYAIMVNYLKVLELTEHPTIPQRAWGFMNDGLRTSVYICYQPPTIACSVIWLAAREAGVPLPTSPAWWEVLDADLEDIENIAGHIKSLYYKKLPIPDLPLTIEETEAYLTKQQQIILAMMDVEKRTAAVGHDTAAQSTGQNAISTAAQTGGKRASRFS